MPKSNAIKTALHIAGLKLDAGDADLMAYEDTWAARRGLLRHKGDTISAYISDNRWVVTCPECNSGIVVLPRHEMIMCLECGADHRVRFPDTRDLANGEAALLERQDANRHWFPDQGEPVSHLRDENRAQGIPTGE